MRQLIRRRGDAKGGSYIDQAGREIETAAARKRRQPCIYCGRMTPSLPGVDRYPWALCDKCARQRIRAAEEEMRRE